MGIVTKDASLVTVNSVTYTRDAAGRILTAVSSPTAENWTYTYDKHDRQLTSVNSSDTGTNRSFTDAAGVGTNRYAYAENDPVNKSDANGHATPDTGGIGVRCDGNGRPRQPAARIDYRSQTL
jgi:YD repeat-containing protein